MHNDFWQSIFHQGTFALMTGFERNFNFVLWIPCALGNEYRGDKERISVIFCASSRLWSWKAFFAPTATSRREFCSRRRGGISVQEIVSSILASDKGNDWGGDSGLVPARLLFGLKYLKAERINEENLFCFIHPVPFEITAQSASEKRILGCFDIFVEWKGTKPLCGRQKGSLDQFSRPQVRSYWYSDSS